MRVLIISPFFPYPTDSGGKTRLVSLLKALAPHHDVTLLALIDERYLDQVNQLTPYCRCSLVPVRTGTSRVRRLFSAARWRNAVARAFAVLQGTPTQIARFIDRQMADRLDALVRQEHFDVVHVEYVQMGWYCRRLPPETVSIVSAVELISVSSAREEGVTRAGKWEHLLGSDRMQRYETGLFESASGVLAMSQVDRDIIISRCPDASVFVIPNGVDDALLLLRHEVIAPPTLLFIGGVAHSPNPDAIAFFLSEKCWPRIKAEYQGIRLRIIGRGWGDSGELALDASIELIDYVDDLSECYAGVSLLVAPIRIGSGTRLKILEAMAAGLPVVSTTVGCEGLHASDGQELLIADDPLSFGNAVSRLLADPLLATDLASRARSHVAEKFLWSQSASRLSHAYQVTATTKAGELG